MDARTMVELGGTGAGPRVSIWIPLDTQGSRHVSGLKLLWRSVHRALPMPSEVQALLADPGAWDPDARGLGILATSTSCRLIWLPYRVPPAAHVGDRFLVGPLLPRLREERPFAVVGVASGGWKVLVCNILCCESLAVSDAPPDAASLTEAAVSARLSEGGLRMRNRGPCAPLAERSAQEALAFYEALDAAILAQIGPRMPVVLVADRATAEAWSAGTGLHVVEVVHRDPCGMADGELHSLAMQAAGDRLAGPAHGIPETVWVAMRLGRGSADPAVIRRMGEAGGVARLIVDHEALEDPEISALVVDALASGAEVIDGEDLDHRVVASFHWPWAVSASATEVDYRARYDTPGDVVSDPALPPSRKVGILREWRLDVLQETSASGEGMAGGPHAVASLRDVDRALARIRR
ncbi:MAG: hypothetical protein KC656_03075 [Myxococcales bacterium]|nr:hypothetical protein [Myxococcales bacterium]